MRGQREMAVVNTNITPTHTHTPTPLQSTSCTLTQPQAFTNIPLKREKEIYDALPKRWRKLIFKRLTHIANLFSFNHVIPQEIKQFLIPYGLANELMRRGIKIAKRIRDQMLAGSSIYLAIKVMPPHHLVQYAPLLLLLL